MTYEPTKEAITDKAIELINEWLSDDDNYNDAMVSITSFSRAVLKAKTLHDKADAILDLEVALQIYAIRQRDFNTEARNALIAENGYTVRTAVDDYKFVAHNTEY
jgi:hypothetical protein